MNQKSAVEKILMQVLILIESFNKMIRNFYQHQLKIKYASFVKRAS
jgi:hypothetical protein